MCTNSRQHDRHLPAFNSSCKVATGIFYMSLVCRGRIRTRGLPQPTTTHDHRVSLCKHGKCSNARLQVNQQRQIKLRHLNGQIFWIECPTNILGHTQNNNNNNFILNYPFTTGAHTVGVAAVHQNLYTYIYMQIKGNQIFKKHCVYSVIV